MNKIIEELEAVQKLMSDKEYIEANAYIDKIKKEIITKKSAEEYVDDLVSNLK